MKIVCPSCHAQYEVPEMVLTSRRKMRCARCGSEWVPGDAPEPVQPVFIADVPPPPPPPVVAEPVLAEPPPVTPPLSVAQPAIVSPMAAEAALAASPEPDFARDFEGSHAALDEPFPHQAVLHDAPAETVIAAAAQPVALWPETPVGLRPKMPDPAAIVVPPKAPGPPVLGWAISLALVIGLAAAAVVYRAPIMKAWPPSTRLYAGLGLVQK